MSLPDEKQQWPNHIDVPVNDWIFTQEQILDAPSFRSASDKLRVYARITALIEFARSFSRFPAVFFFTQVYIRRFFQRYSLSDNDYHVAAVCTFLAARTLEMHISFKYLVDKFADLRPQHGTAGDVSSRNRNRYGAKDQLLKQEMLVMEKLCCDFIIFNPYDTFQLVYSVHKPDNVYEMNMEDPEVEKFWYAMEGESRRPDKAQIYLNFSGRVISWGFTDIILMFPLESVSLAALIHSCAKVNVRLPKDYFKARNLTVDWAKVRDIFEFVFTLKSTSGHPPMSKLEWVVSKNPDVLGEDHNREGGETDYKRRLTSNGEFAVGGGIEMGSSTQDTEHDFLSGRFTPGTPAKTDYGQGGNTDGRASQHTPGDSQSQHFGDPPALDSQRKAIGTPVMGHTAGGIPPAPLINSQGVTPIHQAPTIPKKKQSVQAKQEFKKSPIPTMVRATPADKRKEIAPKIVVKEADVDAERGAGKSTEEDAEGDAGKNAIEMDLSPVEMDDANESNKEVQVETEIEEEISSKDNKERAKIESPIKTENPAVLSSPPSQKLPLQPATTLASPDKAHFTSISLDTPLSPKASAHSGPSMKMPKAKVTKEVHKDKFKDVSGSPKSKSLAVGILTNEVFKMTKSKRSDSPMAQKPDTGATSKPTVNDLSRSSIAKAAIMRASEPPAPKRKRVSPPIDLQQTQRAHLRSAGRMSLATENTVKKQRSTAATKAKQKTTLDEPLPFISDSLELLDMFSDISDAEEDKEIPEKV